MVDAMDAGVWRKRRLEDLQGSAGVGPGPARGNGWRFAGCDLGMIDALTRWLPSALERSRPPGVRTASSALATFGPWTSTKAGEGWMRRGCQGRQNRAFDSRAHPIHPRDFSLCPLSRLPSFPLHAPSYPSSRPALYDTPVD